MRTHSTFPPSGCDFAPVTNLSLSCPSPPTSPQPLVPTLLLSSFMSSSHDAIFVLFWLISLYMYSLYMYSLYMWFLVPPILQQMTELHALCGWIPLHCKNTPHFLCSSSNGQLRWIHILVIVNNSATYVGNKYLLVVLISFPLHIYTVEELLAHMTILFSEVVILIESQRQRDTETEKCDLLPKCLHNP